MLGFDLLLPTGTTIEMPSDTQLIAATPYTFEEAERWIDLNLPANGYTLLSKEGPADGEIIFVFQRDSTTATITVTQQADGMAQVEFVVGA